MTQNSILRRVASSGSRFHNGAKISKGALVRVLGAVVCCFLFVSVVNAQISRYETFVYTSDRVDVLIQNEYAKQGAAAAERGGGYLDVLGGATYNAVKGIAGGYVTSVIDIGVNAIAALITQNSNNKIKWEEIVKAENSYMEKLTTVEAINNFYSYPSFDGPLDPAGMNFDGIGCLRTNDGDTTFYISCRLDPNKISRIINHSKFELSLDTLIIDPFNCDLPNSGFDSEFSFDRHRNLQFVIEIHLISSWVNELTQFQKNQELGSFVISVPVNKDDLDANGKLRYVRNPDVPDKYKISGESFIIPRSYMGYRDEKNNYKNSWGTGDYNIELLLKQTCGITDAYRKNWKPDWNKRKSVANNENFLQRSWTTVTSQRWDEITKRWVITTLKAPAGIITTDLLTELDLPAR